MSLADALEPAVPFPRPVPVPIPGPGDAPLVCIQINADWMPYIIGACGALFAKSTWDTTDENVMSTTLSNVTLLIQSLQAFEACPMPVEFRVNPSDHRYWDYSTDGGVTWTRQPDTVQQDLITRDPATTADNTIQPPSGIGGLVVDALDQLAVKYYSNKGAVQIGKTTDRGGTLDSTPVLEIDAPNSYDYPLLTAG